MLSLIVSAIDEIEDGFMIKLKNGEIFKGKQLNKVIYACGGHLSKEDFLCQLKSSYLYKNEVIENVSYGAGVFRIDGTKLQLDLVSNQTSSQKGFNITYSICTK